MAFDDESYAGDSLQYREKTLKHRMFVIIFGTNTWAGKLFDVVLIILILISVAALMLESVKEIRDQYGTFLHTLEWVITICFSLEYAARIWVVKDAKRYTLSFFGIIDLLSILPAYLSLIIAGSQSLAILRAVRLLRIFRILKLAQFVSQGWILLDALKRSSYKIVVFFMSVLILVFIMGSIMYLVEGPENGFVSIPVSVYWAIVTLTTVGFGDITPNTPTGQFIASIIMLIGYSIIAIPTGIVGAEMYTEAARTRVTQKEVECNRCGENMHLSPARHCHRCGEKLPNQSEA